VLPALAALGLALASAPLDLPSPLEADPFTASVAVGAGWESNLTRQPGPGPAATAGSLGWRTAAGWIFGPGDLDTLLVEATYAGEQYAGGLAPAEHRPGASIAWARPLGERLRLRLGGFGEYLGSEDPLRRGAAAGASLSLALPVGEPLLLRVGAAGFRTATSGDAYAIHRTRLRASAALTPWRGATLVLGYAWQVGTDTAFVAAPAAAAALVQASGAGYGAGAGAGTGAGTGSATWLTSSLTAVRTPASAHVVSLDAEQELGGGLFLAAGWSWTSGTSTAAGGWSGADLQVQVGWRR